MTSLCTTQSNVCYCTPILFRYVPFTLCWYQMLWRVCMDTKPSRNSIVNGAQHAEDLLQVKSAASEESRLQSQPRKARIGSNPLRSHMIPTSITSSISTAPIDAATHTYRLQRAAWASRELPGEESSQNPLMKLRMSRRAWRHPPGTAMEITTRNRSPRRVN